MKNKDQTPDDSLLHTQEVTGSSPVAPTIKLLKAWVEKYGDLIGLRPDPLLNTENPHDSASGVPALLEACDRLLAVEAEVGQMPKEQREWFFGKEGHADCFMVARALKHRLLADQAIASHLPARSGE